MAHHDRPRPSYEAGTEWLRGEGESSDVVMSSRARLARNLEGCRFASRATRADRAQLLDACRNWILQAGVAERLMWVDLHDAPALERQLLVERHLISKNLSKGKPAFAGAALPGQAAQPGSAAEDPRAVAISLPDERLSIMVNEEDHLRIQVIRSGLALSDAWRAIDAVDDRLELGLDYAFSERFGYLTACPTNVGTGLRMSVMLHLPGLKLTGDIEKVRRAATDMNLAVRGFYGEGSEAAGDFYQLSNQTTLGRTEARVIEELERDIIPKVVEYERMARRTLLAKRKTMLEDQVHRALGTLLCARLLATDEAMQLLSHVRLGAVMGMFKGPAREGPTREGPTREGPTREGPPREGAAPGALGPAGVEVDARAIHQLMLLVQPAHLQRSTGRELDQEQRRVARATLVRSRLLGAIPRG